LSLSIRLLQEKGSFAYYDVIWILFRLVFESSSCEFAKLVKSGVEVDCIFNEQFSNENKVTIRLQTISIHSLTCLEGFGQF
jgi:hypothetical protein